MRVKVLRAKAAGHVAIVVFCVWHMAAVFAYALPPKLEGTVWDAVNNALPESMEQQRPFSGALKTISRPYVLYTSQWQQWNLFAPDPLRRVTSLEIQQQEGSAWNTIGRLSPDTVGWWESAYILKIVRRIEEEGRDDERRRLLELACRDIPLAPGTALRLQRRYYVIPRGPEITKVSWWRDWEPTWTTETVSEYRCPAAA